MDNSNSEHGSSVSISDDGAVVAVSGMVVSGDDYLYTVSVYKEVDNVWIQLGATITEATGTGTAYSSDARAEVSLSGDGTKLAIANVKNQRVDSGTTLENSSVVKVYSHSLVNAATAWNYEGNAYTGGAGGGGEHVGLKVSMNTDGSRLAIGVQYDDNGGVFADNDGKIIVLHLDYSSNVFTDLVEIEDPVAGDYAGTRVMISGNGLCVVFGSIGSDNSSGVKTGSASVYCDNGGTWSKRYEVFGEGADDEFGFSVAINDDADYIAVGARYNDPTTQKRDAGHVRVFKWSESLYTQIGADIDGVRGEEDGSGKYYVGDQSGYTVALSNVNSELGGVLRVAIGAPSNNGPGTASDYYNGHVRLFQCDPDSCAQWDQIVGDINGVQAQESSGSSISMSKDGRRIIIGAPGFDTGLGVARVWDQVEDSSEPSSLPSVSLNPSAAPSDVPSLSAIPSAMPSNNPSVSLNPSDIPSNKPSGSLYPSDTPSNKPSASGNPSAMPSSKPSSSGNPSDVPSSVPSLSAIPSAMPSNKPSVSLNPSSIHSDVPSLSLNPSSIHSDIPSLSAIPSAMPSNNPSVSLNPSDIPSNKPSGSLYPSDTPSNKPSASGNPSAMPSDVPSLSAIPSAMPSNIPSVSLNPSSIHSDVPSVSLIPSSMPSDKPSLSLNPSSMPSNKPSLSLIPSAMPSNKPSLSAIPSAMPSDVPSVSAIPSAIPSNKPSLSLNPSDTPSSVPSVSLNPSSMPSNKPSLSAIPSEMPSDVPSVSAIPSAMPSDVPSVSAIPSVAPSTSNAPSSNPSSHLDREFTIRSVFTLFDQSRNWCLTAMEKGMNSKIKVRPCVAYDETGRSGNLQLWKRNEHGQLLLAGPTMNEWCLKSLSKAVFLDNCSSGSTVPEDERFDVVNNRVVQVKNTKTWYVGFDPSRRFSSQYLYKSGSLNDSIDKYRITYADDAKFGTP